MAANADRDWIATLIAVQEGRSPVPLLDDAGIADLLRSSPRIAVIGASDNPGRPVYGVMEQLRRYGYDLVAVSPAATEVQGRPCYPTLADAVRETGPGDIVDMHVRPERRGPVFRLLLHAFKQLVNSRVIHNRGDTQACRARAGATTRGRRNLLACRFREAIGILGKKGMRLIEWQIQRLRPAMLKRETERRDA